MTTKALLPTFSSSLARTIGSVPREHYLTESAAFEEGVEGANLSAKRQTLPTAQTVAQLMEALELEAHSRVLEVGTGSGYLTTILSLLCAQVYSLERSPARQEAVRIRLQTMGRGNVALKLGDGLAGWPDEAPFDAILVAISETDVESCSPS
ncbi:MAG: hypothetical protein H0U74_10915 [Bradymonadaceae bacterium]|nr:hypothetical protein [Lujinxingiaceae bacterium]